MSSIPIGKILFLDIETVSEYKSFDMLTQTMQELFDKKTQYQRKDDFTVDEFYKEKGAIFSEFSKIICISAGFIYTDANGEMFFRVKSYSGHSESDILLQFKKLLDAKFNTTDTYLCAHNGKEFDFPFIARRMIINKITLPTTLNIAGKKPWEIHHLDTMELWKFGDYKHFTSVKLLTEVLGIPSPKDDIDGSEVGDVYYKENNLQRIVNYCEKDAFSVAQIYMRLIGLPIMPSKNMKKIT